MIEIITAAGTILDLDKDQDIQVEMEQPLLDSDHLPVAYSTPISFPISDTNKTAFGYIPAMMLEPTVREVDASIFVFGRAIFTGTLVYDGVEDGKLRYIFTEKGLNEELEKDIAPEGKERHTWQELNTEGNKYRAPILIDKRYATKQVYPRGATPPDAGMNDGDPDTYKDIKYRNCGYNHKVIDGASVLDPDNGNCKLMPVVSIASLLGFLDQSNWDRWGRDIPDALFLLCPYGELNAQTNSSTNETFWDIDASVFPEATISEILKNFCAMYCAGVYKDGNKYSLYPGFKIFSREESAVLFWDDKISDVYSLAIEPKKNYSFSMGEDPIEGGEDSYESNLDGYADGLDLLSNEYSDRHHRIQDMDFSGIKIYSVKSHPAWVSMLGTNSRRYDTEIVYRNDGKSATPKVADEDFDVKCDFKYVHTVPDRYIPAGTMMLDFKAPLIDIPDKNDGRGKDLIIGLMTHASENNTHVFPPSLVEETLVRVKTTLDIEYTDGDSILPVKLYDLYHRAFANWMGTDRTVVKADLLLNMDDLTQLALYKRVNFRGRDWMIKKLSLTFHTDSNRIETTGEFISL